MTETTRELLARAMSLPPEERLTLARELIESVGEEAGELSPAWVSELERRVREVVAGRGGPDDDWRLALDRIRRGDSSRS